MKLHSTTEAVCEASTGVSPQLLVAAPKAKLPPSTAADFGFSAADLDPRHLPKEFVKTSPEVIGKLAKIDV